MDFLFIDIPAWGVLIGLLVVSGVSFVTGYDARGYPFGDACEKCIKSYYEKRVN